MMRPRPPCLLRPRVNVHHALGHSCFCFCSSILQEVERVEQVGTLQAKGCSITGCDAFSYLWENSRADAVMLETLSCSELI